MTQSGSDNDYLEGEMQRSPFEPVEEEEIVGLDHTTEFVDKFTTYVNNIDYFQERDAEFPDGVIFVGKRGTGKTMMSRYAATQMDAAFVDTQQFEWQNRSPEAEVDKVYEWAQRHYEKNDEPVLLFQDEFDDVFDIGGHGGKSDQATKLMQQLSGKEGSGPQGVYLIGTANEIPDARNDSERALFRKGRLEAFHFSTPSREQREDLINHYVDEKYDQHDVSAEAVSRMFSDETTPAEIEALVNQAYTNSVMRNMDNEQGEPQLTTEDLAEELVREETKQKQEVDRSESERERTAIHEGGHYVVAQEVGLGTPIVSIEPQVKSLGQTHLVDPKTVTDFDRAMDYATTAAAGYVAEKRHGYDPMSGISGDLDKLNSLSEQASTVMDLDTIFHKYVDPETDVPLESLVSSDEFEEIQASMNADSMFGEIMNAFEIMDSADRAQLGGGKTAVKASALNRANEILEDAEQTGEFNEIVETLLEEETVIGKELP